MLVNLLKTVFPGGERRRNAAARYSLYLSQQAAHHHFDSLRLALGVLEFGGDPRERAAWLLRVAEAADKCALAIDECLLQQS